MPNLIDSFGGKRRFYDKFNGSMFKDTDGDSLLVSPYSDNGTPNVACKKIGLTASGRVSSQTTIKYVPHDFFQDMGVFGLPELGWRASTAGKVLIYYQKSDTTYHRGTSVRVLHSTLSPITDWLVSQREINLPQETVETKVAYAILNPTFHSLAEGLALIREGRLASFAINHKLAVVPNPQGDFTLLYKTNAVGTISDAGAVTTNNSYAQTIIQGAES